MMSIDVEDYFHVSAFEDCSPPESWHVFESRVERNTGKILDILDEFDVKATFFVLGWVARSAPKLVRRIAESGHEIASHGFHHRRIPLQDRKSFREDIRSSKSLLEDLSGTLVKGYRAPSYSINRDSLWAFDELTEAGYLYDSSVFPVKHDYYGISDWPCKPFPLQKAEDGSWQPGFEHDDCWDIFEIPITTLEKAGRNIPVAGGGYFRLYPYALSRSFLGQINSNNNRPFVFYIHPWEFDPEQPRMKQAGWKSKFRHYLNLHKTEKRFIRLLEDFNFSTIDDFLSHREISGLDSRIVENRNVAPGCVY